MVLAWMVFGSLSVLFPRYFKTAWPDKKLLGDAVWFQVTCIHSDCESSAQSAGLFFLQPSNLRYRA